MVIYINNGDQTLLGAKFNFFFYTIIRHIAIKSINIFFINKDNID